MKKGFTLIEVIAILAILAIIALITTPVVLNVIRSTQEDAFAQTASSLVSSIQTYQANNGYSTTLTVTYPDNNNTLPIDGDQPDAGTISIDANGKVKLALWDEDLKLCVTKETNYKEVVTESVDSKTACTNKYNTLQ